MIKSVFGAALAAGLLAQCAVADPGPTTPAAAGARLFADNCSACHGAFGAGDGPASGTATLVMQDLRYISARNGGDFPETLVLRIVDGRDGPPPHLRGGMPVWGEVFARRGEVVDDAVAPADAGGERIAALVAYLRQLQRPSSPRITLP